MRGVLKIYDESESPSDGARLTYMMNRNCQVRGSCLRYMVNWNRHVKGRVNNGATFRLSFNIFGRGVAGGGGGEGTSIIISGWI